MAINFFTPPHYALNNFSPHAIEYDGKLYPTAEHAYQAAKILDPQAKEAIRIARSPLATKKLANKVFRSHRDPRWEDKKVEIMESILRTKLAQHEEVRQVLENTDAEDIVEDSPTDYFWGEGKDGTGRNELGKLWIKIRSELK